MIAQFPLVKNFRANQWAGFCMITASVMKELSRIISIFLRQIKLCQGDLKK